MARHIKYRLSCPEVFIVFIMSIYKHVIGSLYHLKNLKAYASESETDIQNSNKISAAGVHI